MFCDCEFGQRLSNAFEEIDNEIETFDWYLFPYELKQMLPIILLMTQKPVEFECFGSISISRKYFKKVGFNLKLLKSNSVISSKFTSHSCSNVFFLFFRQSNAHSLILWQCVNLSNELKDFLSFTFINVRITQQKYCHLKLN